MKTLTYFAESIAARDTVMTDTARRAVPALQWYADHVEREDSVSACMERLKKHDPSTRSRKQKLESTE